MLTCTCGQPQTPEHRLQSIASSIWMFAERSCTRINTMKAPHADPAAFELLQVAHVPARSSLDLDTRERQRLEDTASFQTTGKTQSRLWKLAYFLPFIASIAPLAALLAISPRLSTTLGENGCLPNGEFALPWTSSIWEASQSFSITMGFTGNSYEPCTTGASFRGSAFPTSTPCLGYSFTTVKMIDIAFDVLVGRLGQAALAATAYTTFRGAILSMMQQTEVGYDAFSAIAFKTGTLASLPALGKHAVSKSTAPRSTGYRWLFIAMAFSTIYIIAVPTMVSAMSGYRSYYVPYVSNNTYTYRPPTAAELAANGGYAPSSTVNTTNDIVDCYGSLKPLLGQLDLTPAQNLNITEQGSSLFIHDDGLGFDWIDCEYAHPRKHPCNAFLLISL